MISAPIFPGSGGSSSSIDWVEKTLTGEQSGKMLHYYLAIPLSDIKKSVVAYFPDFAGCLIAFKDGTNHLICESADASIAVKTTEDTMEITGERMLGPETTNVMYLVV